MSRWVLTQRPQGKFDATRDCAKKTEPIPELKKDDVLVEVEMLSVDAFVRTMLDVRRTTAASRSAARCQRWATEPSSARAWYA